MSMPKYLLTIFFIFLTCLQSGDLWASNIDINTQFNYQKPIEYSYTTSVNSLESALLQKNHLWLESRGGLLNLGLQNNPVWMKFNLINSTNETKKIFVVLSNPLIDKLSLYQITKEKVIQYHTIGDTQPISRRTIKDESLLFSISLAANSHNNIYLEAQSEGTLKLPLSVWTPERYVQHKSKFNLLIGLLLGFLFALIISNLLISLLTRNSLFLMGSLYITCLWAVLTGYFGLSYRYFNLDAFWLQQINISTLLLCAVTLLNPITEKLLYLAKNNKKHLTVLRISFGLTIIIMCLNPWLSYSNSLIMSFTIGLINMGVYLVITSLHINKKTKHAKTVFAYLFPIFLTLVHGILLFNDIIFSTLTIQSILIVCFLSSSFIISYLLIVQFITQRDEKAQQQHQLIAEVRAKDKLLEEKLKIQNQAQQGLESKIQERTFELEITLRELEEKNRELEEKNTHDALTSIRNRLYFDKKLAMEFRRSRREQKQLAILMLDIDHFKIINDSLGHLAGDEAIKFVANTIKESLQRPSDEACRYGGEEFSIILPNTPTQGAIAVAESIRKKIEAAKIHTSAGIIEMTISAGVHSAIAELNQDPNQHTALADKALYKAKETGRNRVLSSADQF
ncbi:hypothetical protein CJF42_24750 [Pseudoalteromonas sp. NBT06-2]|nr:hypothetical protein CJF42_24750 [Pseudoalteromonas sp. NBT06-2]